VPGEEPQLTKDLEASIVGLPPQDYRVLVGWDPQLNQDVGWITVRRGVEFNFDSLQVRDFNLNFRGLGVDGGAIKEYPSNRTITDTKLSVMHDNKDVLKNKEKPREKCLEEQFRELPPQKLHVPNDCLSPGYGSRELATCGYCKRKVSYLPVHEKKCPVKNAKNQERVDCPFCDFKPTSVSISGHLRTHFRSKRTCPLCKNVILEERYDSHLQKCRHRKKWKHPDLHLKKQPCNMMNDERDEKEIEAAFTGNDEKINKSANVSGISFEDKSEEIAYTFEYKREDLVGNGYENLNTKSASVDSNSNGYMHVDENSETTSILNCTSESSVGYKIEGNNPEDECRLHFEFQGDKTIIKKNIKISMFEPVEKAMKKFRAYKKCVRLFGSNLEDLEFKSNDTLLTGEEYAGSIEDGLIKVNIKSGADHQDRRGGSFVDVEQSNPPNLQHFPHDQKNDVSVLRPSEALCISENENFEHDDMEIDSTEVIVKFAEF